MKPVIKKEDKKDRESLSYEIIFSISLLLVFVLVIVTGVMSYMRLDHIINTVNNGSRPDRKLLLVKEIYNDLSEAENNVKSYALTRNEDYLSGFYKMTDITGDRFNDLEKLVSPEDTMAVLINQLDGLVDQKFGILNKLLLIQDEFRVQQAMDRVMQSIREQEKDTAGFMKTDTVIVPVTFIADTDSIQPAKKENFFTRLFRRKNKEIQPAPDTVIWMDTIVQSVPVIPPPPSVEKISQEVRVVRQQALSRENILRKEEYELVRQDRLIMDQIRAQLNEMEALEAARMAVTTRNAERKAAEVRFIIMSFGLAASLLLLLTALVIFSYTRKNYKYRRVLKNAKDQAEELARVKERFLANMSHEIRTPMNIISGFTGQLLESRMEQAQRDQLTMVKKSSDHLLHILNDLLDLSRLQAGRMELVETSFSPAGIIKDIQQWLEPAAREKNITLVSEADGSLPPYVLGDPVRIRQILLNLAGNAIKFTDIGEVALKAYSEKDKGETVRIFFEVTDTGIGISENDMEKIFEEFEQASDPARRKASGAGLGLAITRRLVNLQGGELTVNSSPGKGSTFRVGIPFRKSSVSPPIPVVETISSAEELNGLRVLVVDDEEFNIRLMRAILRKYGCSVTEAGSGEESLSLTEKHDFDLVLMDMRLPGISGSAAALGIKERSARKHRNLPVVAVSAALTAADQEAFKNSGVDGFLPKPYREEQLVNMILSIIKQYPPFPVYDLASLEQTSGGDKLFFREMVELFIKGTAEGLDQLGGHLDNEEWEKAADIAHKISSPCRHLKAERLYGFIKQVELRLRAPGEHQPVDELLRKARTEFELIRNDILTRKEII